MNELNSLADGGKGEVVAWKDEIIGYLQSSFDSEGITEIDSGDELIRLSSAIAAVEEVAATAPQAECAPRADLMQVANRVAAEFRDLASKLPDDVLVKLFSRADADTAGAKPIAWLIDPGAGSAKDRLQSIEPSEFQLAEINRRGGSVTPLVAAGASNERADADTACDCNQNPHAETCPVTAYARAAFRESGEYPRAEDINSKELDQECSRMVDEHFWELTDAPRADAEKDAALGDIEILEIADRFNFSGINDEIIDFARAILAANKRQING